MQKIACCIIKISNLLRILEKYGANFVLLLKLRVFSHLIIYESSHQILKNVFQISNTHTTRRISVFVPQVYPRGLPGRQHKVHVRVLALAHLYMTWIAMVLANIICVTNNQKIGKIVILRAYITNVIQFTSLIAYLVQFLIVNA